jgi:hypothetical protein
VFIPCTPWSSRSFHLLLRTHRLYNPEHPRVLDSLDQAYDELRNSAVELNDLEIRVATDLQRVGIHTLFVGSKANDGVANRWCSYLYAAGLSWAA